MGIFGDLDAEQIPDNPYWVSAGEYTALVTNAYFQKTKAGKDQFIIVYTITDEDSEYFNQNVQDWFEYYPEITGEMLEKLSATEKQQVRRALAAIKRRLCGTPGTERKGLGVDPVDLDENWDPKSILNTEVIVAVSNGGSNNEYVNVKYANKTD
jgi:hypothetical protein